MIKRIVLFLSFSTIVSCSSPKQPVKEKILNLTGIWTSGETENATFQIDEDSKNLNIISKEIHYL
jgi:hypothetical protein